MKDWLRKIGHWVVINNEIESASPGDVGRLAYIKELLTSGEYDYRVATDKNGLINVKEKELNTIPQDKLDRYLDIMKWSYAKYPGNGFKFKIHNRDYLNELLELEDAAGDKDWIPFSGLVNGDESEDVIMSEEKVKHVVDNVNLVDTTNNKEIHKNILNEIHDTYIRKNADYGNSFEEQYKEYGLLSALIRFDDKIRRLKQLNKHEAKVKDESIRDSALDLANYAIMTVMELDKRK